MRQGAHIGLVVSMIVGGIACNLHRAPTGFDDSSDADTTAEVDVADVDGAEQMETGPVDTGETCAPRTECAADECGTVSDGCGGELECGACNCVDGTPDQPRCGACDLGVRECGAEETGPGTCLAPDLPGLPEEPDASSCESTLLFVDSSASDGGVGTRESSFATYAAARAAASSGQTIVLASEMPYGETLTIAPGVSVIGGFSAGPDFAYSDARRATFEVAADRGTPVEGLVAEGIEEETTVADVLVTTENAEAGQNNYAAYVVDSPALTLRNVRTEAGKGGHGENGEDGGDGADGEDGGEPPAEPVYFFDRYAENAGTNTECMQTDGGAGGRGGVRIQGPGGTENQAPVDGADSSAGVSGGDRGVDGVQGPDGENGRSGDAGADGEDGSPTEPGGAIDQDRWVPVGIGEDGEAGAPGEGGGGGGGAYRDDTCHADGTNEDTALLQAAPAGAGGAAGGCGASGGEGGDPGGGSFGLFAVRSDLTLIDSEFRADFGGNGGAGGNGGSGGDGGEGAAGSSLIDVDHCPPKNLDYTSGDGGDGGSGGEGGHGAGGSGGVSYGAYCAESTPAIEGETRFVAAGEANGGQSKGNGGLEGIAEDSIDCGVE